ncbi:MAG: methyltransferase family protein [Bacteroidales bacterium]
MKEILRHIAGYIFGVFVFILLIPFGLIELSSIDCLVFDFLKLNNSILRIIILFPFFLIGIFFILWSNFYLCIIGKGGPAEGFNISISPKTKKLVTHGPYRYSRNPMVFGAFLLYISLSVFLNSIICLLSLLVFLYIVIKYLKLSEEKRLQKDFGDEFTEYRNKVPMIIPYKFRIK